MSLTLGMDTGGTYTDGVIINRAENNAIIRKAKSPTTRENLVIGIRNCIEALQFPNMNEITLVALSTTLATNSVVITEVNEAVAAEGTAAKLEEVMAALMDGSLKVFDTTTFTVGGKTLDSYMADVDDMGDFVPETEAIADGYFHESEYRSAPYFDMFIDGITNLDA